MKFLIQGITFELQFNYNDARKCYSDAVQCDSKNNYAKCRRVMVKHIFDPPGSYWKSKWDEFPSVMLYKELCTIFDKWRENINLPRCHLYVSATRDCRKRVSVSVANRPFEPPIYSMREWPGKGTISILKDVTELVNSESLRQKCREYDIEKERYRVASEARERERKAIFKQKTDYILAKHGVDGVVIKSSDRPLDVPISWGPIDIDPTLEKDIKEKGRSWGRRD